MSRRRVFLVGLFSGMVLGAVVGVAGFFAGQVFVAWRSRPLDVPPVPAPIVAEGQQDLSSPQPQLSYWLNAETDTRHNAKCRYFERTKNGRPCGSDDGRPCGICGG